MASSTRVLIVDDEDDLLLALAERLEMRGFEVVTADKGSEALELVDEVHFDVAILDIKMPGMDGLELMARLKEKHPALPVILCTGHGSGGDVRAGMTGGAYDYLMKPIDMEALMTIVRSAIGRKEP
jgi:DNA-binding NtrC family response regulator